MATKAKLMKLDTKHTEWIKRTAKDLGMYEMEVMAAVIEYAMSNDVMGQYKTKMAANKLEKTLSQLSSQAKSIAELQERANNQLRILQTSDGEKE